MTLKVRMARNKTSVNNREIQLRRRENRRFWKKMIFSFKRLQLQIEDSLSASTSLGAKTSRFRGVYRLKLRLKLSENTRGRMHDAKSEQKTPWTGNR
jgi:hypothetical protein